MRANEKSLLRFLEGTDKHFVIPVYQRNYDWKKEHCERLFDDLLEIIKSDYRSHFLGSIVSIYRDDSERQEYLIIDGQQRLTTISILLLAICNVLDNQVAKTQITKTQIHDEYLINKYSPPEKKIRLKPIKKDNEAFVALFDGPDQQIEESNITRNYRYFLDRLQNSSITMDDLFKAIKRLVIVEIELKSNEDDPQLIFESLNSTGLSLNQADLARNFILMNEPLVQQENFYTNYWNKIELQTNFQVSEFIRNYLTLKQNILPKEDRVYIEFKRYVIDNKLNDDVEPLLRDLLYFSKLYNRIVLERDKDNEINEALKKLNNLEITVCRPLLLGVFDDFEQGKLLKGQVLEILAIIENFSFRRIICDISPQSLGKFFMILARDIKKNEDHKNSYVEILKYLLLNKKAAQRFPTDEEFSEKLMSRDIYNLKGKNKLHLLEHLENFKNKERVNVEELLETNELKIEHIMPQKLTAEWKEALGSNWSEIHEKYLHTMGNLTLTGYNSEMGNKPFVEKCNIAGGFKESRLHLNKDIKVLSKWGLTEIHQRARILKDIALQIWPFVSSNYKTKLETESEVSLAEEYEFTGEKIDSFTFDKTEYKVKSWRDFYCQTCRLLYDFDAGIFRAFLNNPDFKGKKRILISESDHLLRNPLKIAESLYVESNLSTEGIINMVRLILQKYGLSEDEISFKLVQPQEVLV